MQYKNINLRALEPEDLEFLYQWENDPEVWKISNTYAPFSKFILRKYLEDSHLDIYQTKQLRMIIEHVGPEHVKPIGAVDLFDFDPHHQRAGIGILIADKTERKKGFGKTALKLLIDYSFKVLKLHQLYCNISTSNNVSLKLFEKTGFGVIGIKKEWTKTHDGWMDEYMLQLINHHQ
jgi:diamine N-acetyltransferase